MEVRLSYPELLDSDPADTRNVKYRNIIPFIGVFHECKMFAELIMDMLFGIGCDKLAAIYTFETESAQAYLRRAGDLHKADDFIRNVVKPSLHQAAIITFIKAHKSVNPEWNGRFTSEEVYLWLTHMSIEEDFKIKNFVFVLLKMIPAYELIKRGIRTGDLEAYNAGRRFLLPYCFALGRITYAPMITRDMIQYYHCAPPEVRESLRQIFCLYDEGFDGKLEERNKGQKALVTSSTEIGIQAAALLCDVALVLRKAMCSLSTSREQSETTDNTADLKYTRKVVDLVEDVKQCTLYLLQKKV